MTISLALGTPEEISPGHYRLILGGELPKIRFITGPEGLLWKWLFNMLSPYNEDTGTGSVFNSMIGQLGGTLNDNALAIHAFTAEFFALESRFKSFQDSSPTILSDENLLGRADLLNVSADFETQTILVDFSLYNILGQRIKAQV